MKDIHGVCWKGGPRFEQWIKEFQDTYNVILNVFGYKADHYYSINVTGYGFYNDDSSRGLLVITFDDFLQNYAQDITQALKAAYKVTTFYSII
jgi:hypothetical protein